MGKGLTKDKISFRKEGGRRDILRFALPVAGSGMFQQAYSLFHAAVVSRALSLSAIAVLGACGAFVSMQSFIANGMTTGFGIYLSRCYGRGDEGLYRKSFTAAIALNGGLMVFSVVLAACVHPLMVFARIPEELWTDSKSYLQMLIIGTGFLGFRNLMINVLQGAGDSAFPGMITAAGVVTQTIFLTILIRLGLGIVAPPLTILLNNAMLGTVMYVYFRKKYPKNAGREPFFLIERAVWRELLANGFSKAGMMMLVGIGGFVMQRAKNTLDTAMLAGASLADTLSNFFLVFLSALAQTASVAVGQNMGRGEYNNIQSYNRRLLAYHVLCTVVILIICMFAGKPILCFLAAASGDSAVILAGVKWLGVCMPAFLGLGTAMICRNSLQAMGSYRKLIYLGMLEMGIMIAFAQFGVPRFGYTAYLASIAVKWTALGVCAGYWYWKKLRSILC